MKLLQKARNKVFWTRDLLSKNAIGNNLKDIKHLIENPDSRSAKARKSQLLNGLLKHASTAAPFYKKFQNCTSLREFPVINKNIIRENYSNFKSNRFNSKKITDVVTSGSTGVHLVISQGNQKQLRNTADTIYFLQKANFEIGNELIYIRRWVKKLRKSPLMAWLQNVRMIDVIDLSDEYLETLIRNLQKSRSEKGFLSYVSALTQICKYLDKTQSKPLNCNVTSIIAASESLTPYCKFSMEKYFGAPVISRYSTMENGILAQQFPDGNTDFHINWASYIIEVMDLDEDVPVANGVLGRIVITDLFNYVMPMIRYDIGDLGVMDIGDDGIPVLKTLQGRKMDMIFDTSGQVITPAVVWELDAIQGIKQFQLIQNDKKSYTIKLNVEGGFNSDEEVILNYKRHFGDDAIITIEKTNEIPILASGKRKLVCNNFQLKNPN